MKPWQIVQALLHNYLYADKVKKAEISLDSKDSKFRYFIPFDKNLALVPF